MTIYESVFCIADTPVKATITQIEFQQHYDIKISFSRSDA